MLRRFAAIITREEELFVALCPELDVASQGSSLEGALANLREAIELYLEGEEEIAQPEPPFTTFVEVG
jgi:predicted RNase H-like HicB family nuclease